MKYVVYTGVYPFNEVIGMVDAPDDRPDIALQNAITQYKQAGVPTPVVAPVTVQ
jgi:hypothetical protein